MGCRPIKWKSPLLNFNSFYPTSLVHVSDSGLGTPAVLFNNSDLLSVSHHLSLPRAVMVKLDPSTVSVTLCQQTICNTTGTRKFNTKITSFKSGHLSGRMWQWRSTFRNEPLIFEYCLQKAPFSYLPRQDRRHEWRQSVCHVLCTRSRPNTPASHPHINFASLRIKILHSL